MLQTCWQSHTIQALVKVLCQSQGLQTRWQSHTIQAFVEPVSKDQAFQTCWQSHTIQALVEVTAKGQVLQTCWQSNAIQPLVDNRQRSSSEDLLARQRPFRVRMKAKLCKPGGELTWYKLDSNTVKLLSPLGKLTSVRPLSPIVRCSRLCGRFCNSLATDIQ